MDRRRVSLFLFLLSVSLESFAACRLGSLAWLSSPDTASCLQADFGLYGLGISDGTGKRMAAVGWTETYASGFIKPWLSLHGKGYARSEYQRLAEKQSEWRRTTEQIFLQLGHPLQSPIHGAIGRLPLPFGINDENHHHHALDSRGLKFWDRSNSGLRLSIRLRQDLRAEAGGAWDEPDPDRLGSQGQDALSFRLTKLVDLLGGTKLVASYQARTDYASHKLGLGTLVYNEENVSSLEWVRISLRSEDSGLEQIFRFLHRQVARPWAWDLQYEDVRQDSYRLGLGIQRQLTDAESGNLTFSASFHYERLRQLKPVHQSYFLFGASYGWAMSFVGGASGAQL